MTRATIAGGAFAAVLVLLAATVGYRALNHDARPALATPPATSSPTAQPAATHPANETDHGFIYGRITEVGGVTYEGRLRWGHDEEAFWDDTFNGSKRENPWLAQLSPEQRPTERHPIKIFGIRIADHERRLEVRRQLTAPFGEITRIEASGRQVLVTLKSGTVFDLDRLEASDFDDDVRVWDVTRGILDLDSLRISSIEFLPNPSPGAAPYRLYGTVRTGQGDFTGFVLWDRAKCVGTDELDGRAAEGERTLRFDTIRSIARRSHDSSLVTLLDGRELELSDSSGVGEANRGIYVDDRRYGRVLISWNVFKRVDFSAEGSGPSYGDFPPGRPLTGSVTTRAGRRLAGRLVYDLDESETTETFDASFHGVDYAIPFGLLASIVSPSHAERDPKLATVTLQTGEALQLSLTGDLSESNAGMLIFVDGGQRPEYVPWVDVAQVDFDRPPAKN